MSAAEVNDGGPAFPMQEAQAIHAKAYAAVQHIADNDERDRAYVVARAVAVGGMSLRDYFAAHANEDDIATHMPNYSELQPGDERAKARYRHADAMLEARSA